MLVLVHSPNYLALCKSHEPQKPLLKEIPDWYMRNESA